MASPGMQEVCLFLSGSMHCSTAVWQSINSLQTLKFVVCRYYKGNCEVGGSLFASRTRK